uniref:Uncharacterized protein n=1 Tax=Romanomermis culicivorax TaxID=13658 RepID=A0A915JN14_ROMCU
MPATKLYFMDWIYIHCSFQALRRNYLHPEPGWHDFSLDPHRWTTMRDHRLTIGLGKYPKISLGYQDDPTILVNITSLKPYQPALETVKLSVHAFCAALVEIIPFSRDEIRRGLSRTNT